MMTKRSKVERARRAEESARIAEIQSAWMARVPPAVAAEFALGVAAARARGPLPRQPDMPPGTAPRPPRPGREPKPSKDEAQSRRRH